MKQKLIHLVRSLMDMGSFLVLVLLYSFALLFLSISRKSKRWSQIALHFDGWVKSLDRKDISGVSRLYLVEIAFKNMAAKKTRTMITIGGMAIGISFIVFLVSVGYGLQQMVVSRVARLDELRQAEVVPGLSKDLSLNDETIAKFKAITNVTDVLPLIAVVGRVSYQNSVSDLAVYGATADYLKYSALQPVKGTLFESNSLSFDTATLGTVAGITTGQAVMGEEIADVSYAVDAGTWLKVRSEPDSNPQLLATPNELKVKPQVKKSGGLPTLMMRDLGKPERMKMARIWVSGLRRHTYFGKRKPALVKEVATAKPDNIWCCGIRIIYKLNKRAMWQKFQ